jgi:hypothetical protein
MDGSRHSPPRPGRAGLWASAVVAFGLLPLRPVLAAEVAGATAAEAEKTQVGAGAVAKTPDAAGEPDKATRKIPRKLLRQVLGCWQLDGQERWTISPLDVSGAQVVTKLMKTAGPSKFPDRFRRAAVPATLMYDSRQGNFGFGAAGRYRPTLVLFKVSGSALEANLYAKQSPKARFAPTGHTAILQRCRRAVPAARPVPARPTGPPRLK